MITVPPGPVNQCASFGFGCAQAVYHGFGAWVDPESLDGIDGGPVERAVRRVLTEPSFKVSSQPACNCSGGWQD